VALSIGTTGIFDLDPFQDRWHLEKWEIINLDLDCLDCDTSKIASAPCGRLWTLWPWCFPFCGSVQLATQKTCLDKKGLRPRYIVANKETAG
jgi:hypothetical protein